MQPYNKHIIDADEQTCRFLEKGLDSLFFKRFYEEVRYKKFTHRSKQNLLEKHIYYYYLHIPICAWYRKHSQHTIRQQINYIYIQCFPQLSHQFKQLTSLYATIYNIANTLCNKRDL